jgi:hypothetical protein
MNSLPQPEIDDFAKLFEHARNARVSSYPYIYNDEGTILGCYLAYMQAAGNPIQIAPKGLPEPLASRLKADFDSHAKALAFIAEMRKETAPGVCPMCGSFGSGTLDHFLPRADYPEFSIFSRNLVPACSCNSKRGTTHIGTGSERVLHPYFDACLAQRVLRCVIKDPSEAPLIRLEVRVSANHPEHAAIDFHLKHVVLRTHVLGHFADRWGKLWADPWVLLPRLPNGHVTSDQVKDAVMHEVNRLDKLHGSKNNWDSLFVESLLAADVLDFLRDRTNSYSPPSLMPAI